MNIMMFWNVVLPIMVSFLVGVIVAVATSLLNRKKNNADVIKILADAKLSQEMTEKVEQEKEKIASDIWMQLYNEMKKASDGDEKENEEIKKRLENLEKENSFIKEELTKEKEARSKLQDEYKNLQKKWEKALIWLRKNSDKFDKAGIEPFPI